MNCPKCGTKLKQTKIVNVKVDHCDNCGGIWFDKDELKLVRDERDKNLSWLDFDLWNDKDKLSVSGKSIDCPRDGKPLFKIKCGDTDIMVDVCLECHGIWLDKNELDKIISELKEKINAETIPEYINDLGAEIGKLIIHQGKAGIEARHIMIIMKLIEYRFMSQHPDLAKAISKLPK
ncbi:MAG: zf-TFIIB domain-containing protein [Patescibacteria group bacterium]|nr:zf-TFIIB domain-containing protein [Patescibacteria group bacterium]